MTTYHSRVKLLGPNHVDSLISYNMLGLCLNRLGFSATAIVFLEQCLQQAEEHLGPTHPEVFIVANNLANIYIQIGRPSEAANLLACFAPLQVEAIGPNHPDTLITRCTYGEALLSAQRFQLAHAVFQVLHRDSQMRLKDGDPYLALYQGFLGYSYLKIGRHAEAEIHLKESIAALDHKGFKALVEGFLAEWEQTYNP
jgi:tetratricopeptide (TPR) repeat protein